MYMYRGYIGLGRAKKCHLAVNLELVDELMQRRRCRARKRNHCGSTHRTFCVRTLINGEPAPLRTHTSQQVTFFCLFARRRSRGWMN